MRIYLCCSSYKFHRSSQSLLDSICQSYDGVRRRTLPVLYKALEAGSDDDRMKGALWTLNAPSFGMSWFCLSRNTPLIRPSGKYAASGGPHSFPEESLSHHGTEPTLATELVRRLFACEHNEKVNSPSQLQIVCFLVSRFRPLSRIVLVKPLKIVSMEFAYTMRPFTDRASRSQ
jgi:hypothetical protein